MLKYGSSSRKPAVSQPASATSAVLEADDDEASAAGLASALRAAEVASLKLAAKGRLLVIAVFAVYTTVLFDNELRAITLIYCAAFGAIAAALLLLTDSRFERPWLSYALVLLEVLLMANALLTQNPLNPDPWPMAMAFRYENFYYFVLIIVLSVFSYQPLLVLWAGVCSATAWGVGAWMLLARPDVETYAERGPCATSDDCLARFLDPNVVIISDVVKEVLVALLVASLLAAVVWRGRRAVARVVALGEERQSLERLFGRYVPAEVTPALVRDDGWLVPEQREASVLFADIAQFTATVEDMEPHQALAMLNDYFAAASEVIARHGGVVTQFQGDAVLASFNAPVAIAEHPQCAVRAGLELCEMTSQRTFAGRQLQIRVGVNTGTLVAGSVGGPRRLFYTVHGDVVNVASRLEELNKEHGTCLLVSGETADSLDETFAVRSVGSVQLRGRGEPLQVLEVTARPPAPGPAAG